MRKSPSRTKATKNSGCWFTRLPTRWAKSRATRPISTPSRDRPTPDGVQGRGKCAGTFLAWTQQTDNNWFGEGEIKFFIDGDREFPTICGTGTEDYFLGSYGFPQSYSGLYSGTTLPAHEADSLPNRWSLYRWHVLDPITFGKDLKVTIQALGWWRSAENKYRKLNDHISSVAYWYQTEPHAPFPAWDTSKRNNL